LSTTILSVFENIFFFADFSLKTALFVQNIFKNNLRQSVFICGL